MPTDRAPPPLDLDGKAALLATIKKQQDRINELEAQVARAKTEKELAVKTMEMEVTTAHKKLIADAYDKGFQRCKDNFKELKELMG